MLRNKTIRASPEAYAELCFTQINDLKQMLSRVLNFGISYTFAPVLMEAVKDFTRQYPGVRLNIICRTMEELLKKREVDFVLCFKPTGLSMRCYSS